MKKKIVGLIVALGVALFCVPTAFAERPIKVTIGGEKIVTDVAPVAIDGRVLVPVRAVFEALGAKVDYIATEKKVVATKGDTTVEMVIDSNIMKINGEEKTIDVPAMVINNRTLVPLRACGEAFGHDVEWNGNTRTAKIKIPVAVVVEEPDENDIEIIHYYDYDENGNKIFHKISDGLWTKYIYDSNGNVDYSENNDGSICKYLYNEYGDLICQMYYYTWGQEWEKYYYDEYGNRIYRENKSGFWQVFEYDEYGRKIYEQWSNDWWIKYSYDANGNLIYYENIDGYWEKNTYDQNNNLILTEFSNGGDITYTNTYDANGNLILSQNSMGNRTEYTYDDNGILVYETNGFCEIKYTTVLK